MREIIVDNFAGGGGASTGIEIATGRSECRILESNKTILVSYGLRREGAI